MSGRHAALREPDWRQVTLLDRALACAWGLGGAAALLLLGHIGQQEMFDSSLGLRAAQPDEERGQPVGQPVAASSRGLD